MLGNLSGVHLIAILAVVLLLFGAPKLPALAKSIGQSMKILKKEVGPDADAPETTAAAPAPAPAAPASTPAQAVATEQSPAAKPTDAA
ncbi:twin-arginine translocase TatA/TatE family subunit [Leucobacter sp. CSA2]|uniref:Sec-independent protein translocase protein TatA n=1 Tax=Leucobacter edaphi TaxID=2796472 RepID=A0A934QEI2_9MICO|nr:twin-arginine translocase TatA/TatE family subunit [Leucobacter edaphi]MBK0422365.1 twin-arginine translocase TatA/TatE family subunit [Leucobacter edaphi]